MPGLYGDLVNLARHGGMEFWNTSAGTNTTTSAAEGPDMWVLGVGTGSTLNVSRASTGQDTGTFCAGIAYTHVITSEIHQVAGLADMKLAANISFGIRVASATAACSFTTPPGLASRLRTSRPLPESILHHERHSLGYRLGF